MIYTRISRGNEGEALGVARHREDSLARAEREGWQIVDVRSKTTWARLRRARNIGRSTPTCSAVHLDGEHDGSRRVREIVSVPGRVEGDVVELEAIFVRRGDRLRRAEGHPPHADRFGRAGIDPAGLLAVAENDREGAA